MALDADEVVVGKSGHVYVAPVGTAGPTDTDTALGAGWTELGFLSDDGVEFTPGVELSEIMAWQSQHPIRRDVESRSLDASFTLLQWNATTLPFAMGGGSVATVTGVTTYTPPTASEVDERAMVIEWEDGTKKYRLHMLRGMISDLGGFNLVSSDAAGLGVTFSLLAESDVAPFTIISNDPAMVVV